MNLTKKSKIIALSIVAVMFLTVLITAGIIFVPKLYNDDDAGLELTANEYTYKSFAEGGYGMSDSVTFDNTNMALSLAHNNDDDHVWIYYPSQIYMDTSENLSDLGYRYSFYAHYGNSGNSDYHHVLFHSVMGYYKNNSGTNNGQYTNALNANGNMDKFFDSYGLKYVEIYYGAKKNAKATDNWEWTTATGGDGTAYTVTYYEGGNMLDGVHVKTFVDMQGTGKKGSYTYNRMSGTPIFLTRKYGNVFTGTSWQWTLTSFDDVATATSYGKRPDEVSASVPITPEVSIKIEIYDKGPLYNALASLDKKFNALNNAGLLLQSEVIRYNNFKDTALKDVLNERKVTQAQVEAKTTEVNNYVFKAYVPNPDLGTEQSPHTATYNGSTGYNLNNFWIGYNNLVSGSSTNRLSDCFAAGTMTYSLTGYDGSTTNIDNDKKNNITEAGYYSVTFAPGSGTIQIEVGKQSCKVQFTWADGSAGQKTAYFRIVPAEMALSNMPSLINMVYKGNTPNVIQGLPQGATVTVKGPNSMTVQLSTVQRSTENALAWNGVSDTVEFDDVTDGEVTVYFRISATNHFDKYGDFDVVVSPAHISVSLKSFSQLYYEDLLDSDAIYDNMLDESTPNILDATSFAETKAYLEQFLTFGIIKAEGEGYYDASTDKPNAGRYTVAAILTDDADWSKRIDDITFVDDSNVNAYRITARSIAVTWTDNVNKWYNGSRFHAPSVAIAQGQETFGQDVTLSDISVAGDKGTDLINTHAVNAGTYTARVSSNNTNFVVSNNAYEFSILARKIRVEIQDRQITYAAYGDAANVLDLYQNVLLANNTNNVGYIATLDQEIADATGDTRALISEDYTQVFTVDITGGQYTPDSKYHAVGTFTLALQSDNANYEITKVDGTLTVTPAQLDVTIRQVAPKVYNADAQDIKLPVTTQTVEVFGYELENIDDCVTVEYSATGLTGPWSTTPLQITNVIESPKVVYCKVSADNHDPDIFSFTQTMSPVNVMIYFDGQTQAAYYGDPIPTSDELLTICGGHFTVSERLAEAGSLILPEDIRDIHPASIFDFFLWDPTTGQPVVNRNAPAGKYTVAFDLKPTVSEDLNNFNVVFHETNGVRDNIDLYTISPKSLYVEWSQSGDRWSIGDDGVTKDKYTYSNLVPEVFPTAPNSYDGKENVVTGDTIHFSSIELASSNVTADGYTVSTQLTDDEHRNNYTLLNDTHTFYIVPLNVKIAIKDQTAQYGKLQQVTLGVLIDPINAGALWDYAQGSEARFFSDHYNRWKLVSNAISSDESLVNVGDYPIGIANNTTGSGDTAVRANYDIEIVSETGKTATFHIIPADITFSVRQFNIDYDDAAELNYITKQMLVERITTGLESKGVTASQFNVKMSEKFLQSHNDVTEDNADWVEQTQEVTDEMSCGRYYVLFVVEHPDNNFNKFVQKIELNILSGWVSVKVGGGVTDAEYGDDVHTSDDIFSSLDILSIAGLLQDGEQLWNIDREAAKTMLKEYVSLYVANNSMEQMTVNESVGSYSIYMNVVKTDGEYENFRFVARDGERDTSNINAYHVGQRTVSVEWGDMDEEYGDHGNSHTAYTITNVLDKDRATVLFTLEYGIDRSNPRNTASFDDGGHAFTAGTYTATVVSVTNSNYRIDLGDEALTTVFEIHRKTIEIELHDRQFVYGGANSSVAGINNALNIHSQIPNYDVVSRTPFVGSDKRADIFEIYFDGTVEEGFAYLPVDTYVINARQLATVTSMNYDVIITGTGTLTITPASAGLNYKRLPNMDYDSTEQVIYVGNDSITLAGDVEYNRSHTQVGFRFISREDFKEPDSDVYIPEGEFTVRDAGRYVIGVKIEAPNHNVYITEVNLSVAAANIIINMHQAEKQYGDTLDDLKEQVPGIQSMSDWMKIMCGITITMYRDYGGGNREEWDVTDTALDDFEFYLVDPDSQGGDEYELDLNDFQNNVGEYRIHHRMAAGYLASNYIVEYYQAPGDAADCSAKAYKIVPREVSIDWSVARPGDWNDDYTQYYYTGNRPGLSATFDTLPDSEGNSVTVTLQISGTNNVNVNAAGETYTARVVSTSWDSTRYSDNYTLLNPTHQYTIVKRAITVTIDNQIGGTYGNVLGNTSISQDAFTIFDTVADSVVEVLALYPLSLSLDTDGITGDSLLPAGRYKINGNNSNPNYDITFVGVDGGDNGWLTVNKATFSLTATTYRNAKYLGEDFSLDFKKILPVTANAFVDGDDWQTAWANAQITYRQNSEDVAAPIFTSAGTVRVGYTLTFDNYNDYTGSLEVEVQKATVNVSVTAVSSVYGDDLLDSDGIFAASDVTLAAGSDDIKIGIRDIITLYVRDTAVNVGEYTIRYNYIEEQANNFTVTMVDNAYKYAITPRVVDIIWDMNDEDTTLDNGKYMFNGSPHRILADVGNVLDGDTIEPRFEEFENKDQAGTYTARLISIGSNGNYAMPDDCSFEWTILPRPVSVEWTVEEYIYDGLTKVPDATINADDVLLGTSCGITVSGDEINAGTYVATASTTSTNYVVSNATQSFTIKPRQINIVWSNDTFVYDGSEHVPTATIQEDQLIVAGDTINVTVGGAQKNAGTYTATVAALDNTNYIAVGTTKSFVIEKKQVSIHWTDTQFDYTGEEIVPIAKLEGVLSGDEVDVTISGGKSDVGTYTASATGVTNGNYVLAPTTVKEMEFSIEKVNNEFDGLFGKGNSKSDIVGVPWTGDSKPTDKFGGEVTVKYYADKECTQEISADNLKDGTYWAVAHVDGTDNYNELTSAPLEFKIDKGLNVALAVSGIVVSVLLLGGVLATVLVISKKRKGV